MNQFADLTHQVLTQKKAAQDSFSISKDIFVLTSGTAFLDGCDVLEKEIEKHDSDPGQGDKDDRDGHLLCDAPYLGHDDHSCESNSKDDNENEQDWSQDISKPAFLHQQHGCQAKSGRTILII